MKRREFITLLGGAAATPRTARAQQSGKIYRIGFLAGDPGIPSQPSGRAFLDGLREGGFIEGENIIIERRFSEGRLDRYSELVEELVRLRLDVLVTSQRGDAGCQAGKYQISRGDDECHRSARVRHCRELGASTRQHHRFGPGRFGGDRSQADTTAQGCHSIRCPRSCSDGPRSPRPASTVATAGTCRAVLKCEASAARDAPTE